MVTSLTSQLAGKSILVVGGAGALGSAALSLFDSLGAYTVSVDLARQPKAAVSLLLREGEGWVDQAQRTRDALGELLRRGEHGNCMNLVWCTAGGWAGGWVGDVDGLEAVDRMWKVNALSSVLAVHLASHTLDGSGLLVLTGAEAALHGTPDMVGYGMSKSATHHLLHSISHEDRPKGSWTAAGILPSVIDTPSNRASMGTDSADGWVKAEDIAAKVASWINPGPRPRNGAMFSVIQSKGRPVWREVGKEAIHD